MTKTDLRFVITKGYVQLPFKMHDHKGKIVKKQEGGFVEDWEHGTLWALLDLKQKKVLELKFDLKKIIANAPNLIKKAKKTPKEEPEKTKVTT